MRLGEKGYILKERKISEKKQTKEQKHFSLCSYSILLNLSQKV